MPARPNTKTGAPASAGLEPPSFDFSDYSQMQIEIEDQKAKAQAGIAGVLEEQRAKTAGEFARWEAHAEQRIPLEAEAQAAVRAPIPAMPQPTQLPEAPSGPVVDPEKFKQFMGPAIIFSLLLGKVAQGSMVDGLNMLSNAMIGYKTGAQQKADNDYMQFRQKMQAAFDAERQKLARYRQTLERRDLDVQSKLQLLEIDAARENDRRMQFAVLQGNWDAALKVYENQLKMLGQQGSAVMKMQGQVEGYRLRGWIAQMQDATRRAHDAAMQTYHQNMLGLRQAARTDKGHEAQTKALKYYEAESRRITETFERTVSAAVQRAGTNADVVKHVVQEAAQLAAQQFSTLNQGTQHMEWDFNGQTMFLNPYATDGARQVEDPNYWYAMAGGFGSLRAYIPQWQPAASAPGQVKSGQLAPAQPIAPAGGGAEKQHDQEVAPLPPGFVEQQ